MRAELVDAQYRLVEAVDAEPSCGTDFCDECGDCLHCYGGDYCPGGEHRWVVYIESHDQFRIDHPEGWIGPAA